MVTIELVSSIIFVIAAIAVVAMFFYQNIVGHYTNYSLKAGKSKNKPSIDEDDCYYITTNGHALLRKLGLIWLIQLLIALIPPLWAFYLFAYWLPHPTGISNKFKQWKMSGYSTAAFYIVLALILATSLCVAAISGVKILMLIAKAIRF